MRKLAVIVEGSGDCSAVGSVVHRTLEFLEISNVVVVEPMNAKGCGNLDKEGGLEKFLRIASEWDLILVIRDADGPDSAPTLATSFATRARGVCMSKPIAVIVPVKEMENWFVTSLDSIKGRALGAEPGISDKVSMPIDVEAVSGKGFFKKHLPGYKESVHQKLLAAKFDPTLADQHSCSFRKLCKRLQELDSASSGSVFP